MIELEVLESGPIELEVVTASADPGYIPVLIDKTITVNGVYQAASEGADGYRKVTASVPNTYTAGDEGKVVDNGALVSQTARSITSNGTYDTTKNNSVTASVPNTYTAGDEGKVVDNGALVSQTSATYTVNDTYDTTLINEVTVNVSGGGGISVDEFFDRSYPSGNLTANINGAFPAYIAYARTGITGIDASNATAVREYAFYGCTGLTSVSIPSVTQLDGNAFNGCTALASFNAKNVQRIYGNVFRNVPCSALVFPSITTELGTYAFYMFKGQAVDIGGNNLSIKINCFDSATNLTTLIIRKTTVASLANTNAFLNSPFASGGAGGTLYVPQALISSYQSASNWSTILGYANNQIKSIESTHTDPTAPIDLTLYYADGTLIS